jgi:hypothetical protein
MEWLMVWGVAALAVGVVATVRNRSGFGWFLLACVISPLLAVLLLVALGRGDNGQQAPDPRTLRNCPECRELVRRDARLCKHCRSTLTPIT